MLLNGGTVCDASHTMMGSLNFPLAIAADYERVTRSGGEVLKSAGVNPRR